MFYLLFLLLGIGGCLAQDQGTSQKKSIQLIHSDFSEIDEVQMPGVKILKGNIEARQDSMKIFCNNAYLIDKENYIKLFGDVKIIQNDTIEMFSDYAEYNGNSQVAYASGNVRVISPNSKITSQKIYYNRANAEVFYENHAVIQNKKNQLKSKVGRYFVNESRYEFRTSVVLTNPTTVIKTNYLDYYDDSGFSYMKGPSTIKNENHFIYTEDGFYDTKANVGRLKPKSYILYNDKKIEADELYYERNNEYFRGTKNVRLTDTINRVIGTADFAEVFRKKEQDSVYLSQKPLIRSVQNRDSIFYHSKELFITGKDKERIIVGKKNVRAFYEPNMSALADSLHYSQKTGIAEFIGRPIVFRGESQLSGEKIELLNNIATEKLDSIKVLNQAFLIEKDSLGAGFNQAKGINLYGRFEENELVEADLIKNAEMIYYIYNEQNEFVGVDKSICSRINLQLTDQKIETATRFVNPESTTYPPEQIEGIEVIFPGFEWRGNERIISKEGVIQGDEVNPSGEKVKDEQHPPPTLSLPNSKDKKSKKKSTKPN